MSVKDEDAITEVLRLLSVPVPYFKCEECGADISGDSPESTLSCEYQPGDPFERRLQRQQRNPKLPVFQFWYEHRKQFAAYRVRLVCHRGCRRAQTQLLSDAGWVGKNDGQWQLDRKIGYRTRLRLLRQPDWRIKEQESE